MAEPNHNAEEQLKRYAEERRKQPAPELHPATRAMLQGEVTRTYKKRAVKESLFTRWRINPATLWVLPIIGFFVVLSFQAHRHGKEKTSAEQRKVVAPISTASAPEEPKALGGQADTATREVAVKKEAAKDIVAAAPTAAAPPPVTTPPGAGGGVKERGRRDEVTVARAFSKTEADENLSFSNLAPPARQQAVTLNNTEANVMNRFQMERTGLRVRFVDQDKSVYDGRVVGKNGTTNLFRAEGTNQTLRAPVVITGQYFNVRAPGGVQQQRVRAQVQDANQQTLLQGQAVVGTSNQIQIDAQTGAPSR
jgi:hypothetical protein